MTIYFNDVSEMEKVLGINDSNLAYLEFLFSCPLSTRGNQLIIGKDDERFPKLISQLTQLAKDRQEPFSESELYMEWNAMNEGASGAVSEYSLIVSGRSVWPKSRKQKEYLASLFENQVVFATGPAGTGKTFLAIAYALNQVLSGKKQKLVLKRPVVVAGESLGCLP